MEASHRSTRLSLRRLLLALLLGLFIALLTLIFLPPWLIARFLTYPGCHPPTLVAGLPLPEEHWLDTEDGLLLRVWYYPSQNRAAILALGGMGGSLGANLPPIEMLVRRGYGVLQIDSRACARPAAAVTLGYREAQDATAGLTFLRHRTEIDPWRIGVFGFSMGGAAAIRCAARHPEIVAVISEGSYANLKQNFDGYGTGGPLARLSGALANLAFHIYTGDNPALSSPIDDIDAISPRPLLLIYGEAEAGFPAQALWEAASPPKQLWIVPGGNHGKNHLAAPHEYEQRVVEFFNLALLQ